jgi:hypothetical protein
MVRCLVRVVRVVRLVRAWSGPLVRSDQGLRRVSIDGCETGELPVPPSSGIQCPASHRPLAGPRLVRLLAHVVRAAGTRAGSPACSQRVVAATETGGALVHGHAQNGQFGTIAKDIA